jgi:hypothetical protein
MSSFDPSQRVAAAPAGATELDLSEWVALDHMPLNDHTKPLIIATMNGKYKEALNVYVKHFCGKADVVSAQLAGLDETKLVLRYWDTDAQLEESSINYKNSAGASVRASKAGGVRRILLEMARIASEATGDELDLPQAAGINAVESDKVPGAYLLNELIDLGSLECLNQDEENPVTNAISAYSEDAEEVAGLSLQSDPDVDHQLLLKLGFRQPVKLKAITFRGKTEDGTAPKVVKVFQGQMSIGFGEAEDQESVQTLELASSNIDEGDPVLLRFVKFQNVTTLQLFVQSNFGADVTHLDKVEFWGTAAETIDMKGWRAATKDLANPINPILEPERDSAL